MAENNDSEDDEYISTADFGVLAPVVYHAVLVTFGFAHFKTVRDLVYVPVVKKESNCTRPTVAAGLKNSGKGRADNTEYYGDLLGGSDITRSHKTGEITYFGDEGENVRVLGGIKKEPDTEKQREFQTASWIAMGRELARMTDEVGQERRDGHCRGRGREQGRG